MMPFAVRGWLLAGLMLVCAVASLLLRPQAQPDRALQLEALIPASFGDWIVDPGVVPVSPSPDVQANLDELYEQILTRTFVNSGGQRMMLVVAYGGDQSDSLKAHRQEVCYEAQGFTIRKTVRDTLHASSGAIPLVRVHAVKGRRSEPISYWFTMGDRVVIGRLERLLAQLGYGLRGRIPDGMLVRVSSLGTDLPASFAAQDEFISALLEAMSPAQRQRLAGIAAPSAGRG
jgi:EpsI family protein